MKTVTEIIKTKRGTLAALQADYLKLENPGWMPLTLEVVHVFPGGACEVSVCHYGEQNGDLMRDPEMTFVVTPGEPDWSWQPLYYRNDYVRVEQWCAEVNPSGEVTVKQPRLLRELQEFARMWDSNLRQQGFLKV